MIPSSRFGWRIALGLAATALTIEAFEYLLFLYIWLFDTPGKELPIAEFAICVGIALVLFAIAATVGARVFVALLRFKAATLADRWLTALGLVMHGASISLAYWPPQGDWVRGFLDGKFTSFVVGVVATVVCAVWAATAPRKRGHENGTRLSKT